MWTRPEQSIPARREAAPLVRRSPRNARAAATGSAANGRRERALAVLQCRRPHPAGVVVGRDHPRPSVAAAPRRAAARLREPGSPARHRRSARPASAPPATAHLTAASARASRGGCAFTSGQSSSVTAYQAESRGPGRQHHVLPRDPLELRAEREQRPARPLVAGVGLELDALEPAALERVLEQQHLRLDVRAGVPGRRAQPRPADLDAPVVRLVVQVPGRPEHAPVANDRERDAGRRLRAPRRTRDRSSRRRPCTGRSSDPRPPPRAVPRGGAPRAARPTPAARSAAHRGADRSAHRIPGEYGPSPTGSSRRYGVPWRGCAGRRSTQLT